MPQGYVTHASLRADAAPFIASYLADGGRITRCPTGGKPSNQYWGRR